MTKKRQWRILHYPDLRDGNWNVCVMENQWNEVEQAFVSIIDAAWDGNTSGYRYVQIEGFGMRINFSSGTSYYAGAINLEDRAKAIRLGQLHGYMGHDDDD